MVVWEEEFAARGQSEDLVVCFHGWCRSLEMMRQLMRTISAALPDADLFLPIFEPQGAFSDLRGVFSNTDIKELTLTLEKKITDAVERRTQRGGEYRRIIFVGYSLGALLARAVFVRARGEDEGTLQTRRQAWSDRVERIVLVAGMNRGWSLRPRPERMTRRTAFAYSVLLYGSALLFQARLIRSVQRGRPFVVDLRVRWIEMIRRGEKVPLTVQLLGTRDDLISRSDTIDLQCGSNFVYLDVPDSSHLDILDHTGAPGEIRKQVFLKALVTGEAELRPQSDWQSVPALKPRPEVQRLVFLMHGIRHKQRWPLKLGRKLKETAAAGGMQVEVITAGYGYFPMLKFLLGIFRQKNVLWFMDKYIEALAQYPSASFSFVGHSNGTYLLASALRNYAAGTFDRVVFAGSVVPRRFPWPEYIDAKRVGAVRNFVATHDLVVGIFPGLFELMKSKELGTAGHDGFLEDVAQRYEVAYVEGGHGAAICQDNFDAIIAFILGNAQPDVCPALRRDSVRWYAELANRLCWLVWAALVLVAVVVPIVLIATAPWSLAAKAGGGVSYLGFLLLVLLTI